MSFSSDKSSISSLNLPMIIQYRATINGHLTESLYDNRSIFISKILKYNSNTLISALQMNLFETYTHLSTQFTYQ